MPTNLYGPNGNYDLNSSHVLPELIHRAREAKVHRDAELVIWGPGRSMREFLYVDDLADVCVRLMEWGVGEGLYNIGTGEDVTIRELAVAVKEIVGFQGGSRLMPASLTGNRASCLTWGVCVRGWTASTPLRAGIALAYADSLQRHRVAEHWTWR